MQSKVWQPLKGGQSWSWHLTLWLNKGLHFRHEWLARQVKKWFGENCILYLANKVIQACSHSWTLTFNPLTQNHFSSHHEHWKCEARKWLSKNCSLYHVDNVSKVKCQSWPCSITCTPWLKINRVLHLVICLVSHLVFNKLCVMLKVIGQKIKMKFHRPIIQLSTPWPKIRRFLLLIVNKLLRKF